MIFGQGISHEGLFQRFFDLPEVSGLITSRAQIMDYLDMLGIDDREHQFVIDRTLKSHVRRSRDLDPSPLLAQLTNAIVRSVPAFLLEHASSFPREKLFVIRSDEIFHYLPLPRKNNYSILLSS